MSDELIFTVSPEGAKPATAITLADAGMKERADLQQWVIAHPAILGGDVLILTEELGRWVSGTGDNVKDRLDLLGLDSDGRLVVAELKRGPAPDTTEMQAIKYAAMAAGTGLDDLARLHMQFVNKQRVGTDLESIDADEALERIVGHASEIDEESLRQPRIVLLATDFAATTTSTAIFLREFGLDLSLIQFQAYRIASGELVLSVSQLFPLPDLDELTISARPVTVRQQAATKKREARTSTRLVNAGVVSDGTEFVLRPIQLGRKNVDEMVEWVGEHPDRGRAIWRNHSGKPLTWAIDNEHYSLSGLVGKLFEEATGVSPRGIGGAYWWADPKGRTPIELTEMIDG